MFACIYTSMLNITSPNNYTSYQTGGSFTERKSFATISWNLSHYSELWFSIRKEIDSGRHVLLDAASLSLSDLPSASDLQSRENLPSLA